MKLFCLLCDLSLNPPLPPVVFADRSTLKSMSWRDIYPPHRFVKALKALADAPLSLDREAGNEVYHAVSAELSGRCGWLPPSEFGPLHARLDKVAEAFPTGADFEKLGANYEYIDYLFSAQFRFWDLRRENLPFVVCYGGQHGQDPSGNPKDLDLLDWDNRDTCWARPPLLWTTNDLLGYTSLGKDLCNWLLTSTLIYNITHQLYCRTGQYSSSRLPLAAYPPDVFRHEATVSNVEKTFSRYFSVDWIGFS